MNVLVFENEKTLRDYRKKLSEKAMKGKLAKNTITTLMTAQVFGKVFSPKRLVLLITMSKIKTETITELAKKVGRKFEIVYRDLKLFEQFGIVKLTKEKRSVIPELIGEIRLPKFAST